MKYRYILASFAVGIAGMAVSSCSNQDESDPNSPYAPEAPKTEITLGAIVTEISSRWVTQGEKITVAIPEFNFTSTEPDVELTSIAIEHDGEEIASRPYQPGFTITTTVGNWEHGENELTFIANFTTPDGEEVAREFMHPKVIVFDELPRYGVEGTIEKEIKWFASNGEKFHYNLHIESTDHIFRIGTITWIASNGEKFSFNKLADMTPTFSIDPAATNFDAAITSTELHWFTPGGPATLPQDDYLTDRALLYADFGIKGMHEGILVEVDTTIPFTLIGSAAEEK